MKKAHKPTMENIKNASINNARNMFDTQSFRFDYCLVHDRLNLIL